MSDNYFSVQVNADIPLRTKIHILYANIFPELSDIEVVEKGSSRDFDGVDKNLLFLNGSKIRSQEKNRDKDYGDFLIEFNHSYHSTVLDFLKDFKKAWRGWIYKTNADILVYTVPGWAYVMSMHDLKKWVNNNTEKIKLAKWIVAPNPEGDYYTYNKAINWSDLDFLVEKYKF